ncbi:HD domain-containing protein [Dactylosporangium sp. NPDC005572]|uniref:HD domain-containing protein n=1 Tax=Dactylosporangium sp. NPDC005572 TaxID=3156889 RepID=UPI0033A65778
MEHVPWARELASRLLAEPLPVRWAHVQGVGHTAEDIAHVVGDDAELLICAAWLHDIGYAPDLNKAGFHPLDGARYLRDVEQADERLIRLVANHSCALIEARNRDLAGDLASEFPSPADFVLDALTFCDMTTSPTGQRTKLDQRLEEAFQRYGDGHLVTRSLTEARPLLEGSVQRVRAALDGR